VTTDRSTPAQYVVLALARSRSSWLRSVARWSTSGAAPIELVMCVSAAELAARLAEGRPTSAVLLDGTLPSVDRDLLDLAVRSSAAILIVASHPAGRDWLSLGAASVLPEEFGREVLLDALVEHARPVGRHGREMVEPTMPDQAPVGIRAPVAAVCGPGGTGTSTVAAALAQGLAASPRLGPVVLVDLALHAEQAMRHDVGEVAPGIQELVEAHRSGTPSEVAVRSVTFAVEGSGYQLLLGLRRARQWSTIRSRAFDAAFESLCRTFDTVVCDVDPDVEDGPRSGEGADRCLFARVATGAADVVFAVGRADTKGVHSLARVVGDLVESGVPPGRLVPVVSEAPRSPGARSSLARTIGELTEVGPFGPLAPVLFLPSRRVDDAVRDGLPVPSPLPSLVAGAFSAVFGRLGPRVRRPVQPELVSPGSLGLA
jgi:hypothetical protein